MKRMAVFAEEDDALYAPFWELKSEMSESRINTIQEIK